jgi:hypothetical protein
VNDVSYREQDERNSILDRDLDFIFHHAAQTGSGAHRGSCSTATEDKAERPCSSSGKIMHAFITS